MDFYLSALLLSLCLGAMSLGIYITMKIFNIPDITTDGSYTLGAVITAVFLTADLPVSFAIISSMLAGAVAGSFTGLIHTKLKLDALLSGILVMTGLYSVNLIILGRSNIPLIQQKSVFNALTLFGSYIPDQLFIALIIIISLAIILNRLLKTDFGIAMRATGNSPMMTRALGINNDKMKIIGLSIANAMTALSGSLMAQFQGFADINMGIGIVIVGLGSVLIADVLFSWFKIYKTGFQLAIVIFGTFLFQLVLAVSLSLGIDPNLLKLITAIFVLLIVALPRVGGYLKKNNA